jgi:hypothetical protein
LTSLETSTRCKIKTNWHTSLGFLIFPPLCTSQQSFMASWMLRPVADLTHFLGTTPVHPTLFPYPLALTLHAARCLGYIDTLGRKPIYLFFVRVSIAFQNNVRASGNQGKLTRRMQIAGFLVMVCPIFTFSIIFIILLLRYSVGVVMLRRTCCLGYHHRVSTPCTLGSIISQSTSY